MTRQQQLSAFAAFAALCLSNNDFASAQRTLNVEEFKQGIDDGTFDMVLDVRTQEEWDTGHIPGAIHIPIDTFREDEFWSTMDLEAFSCNKDCATIVTHCSRGGRAGRAIQFLRNMGFEGTLLNGQGTWNWENAGYALTTEDDRKEPICTSWDICAPPKLPGPLPPAPAVAEEDEDKDKGKEKDEDKDKEKDKDKDKEKDKDKDKETQPEVTATADSDSAADADAVADNVLEDIFVSEPPDAEDAAIGSDSAADDAAVEVLCVDDPDYRFNDRPLKGCDWVAHAETENRCLKPTVMEGCLATCNPACPKVEANAVSENALLESSSPAISARAVFVALALFSLVVIL